MQIEVKLKKEEESSLQKVMSKMGKCLSIYDSEENKNGVENIKNVPPFHIYRQGNKITVIYKD